MFFSSVKLWITCFLLVLITGSSSIIIFTTTVQIHLWNAIFIKNLSGLIILEKFSVTVIAIYSRNKMQVQIGKIALKDFRPNLMTNSLKATNLLLLLLSLILLSNFVRSLWIYWSILHCSICKALFSSTM